MKKLILIQLALLLPWMAFSQSIDFNPHFKPGMQYSGRFNVVDTAVKANFFPGTNKQDSPLVDHSELMIKWTVATGKMDKDKSFPLLIEATYICNDCRLSVIAKGTKVYAHQNSAGELIKDSFSHTLNPMSSQDKYAFDMAVNEFYAYVISDYDISRFSINRGDSVVISKGAAKTVYRLEKIDNGVATLSFMQETRLDTSFFGTKLHSVMKTTGTLSYDIANEFVDSSVSTLVADSKTDKGDVITEVRTLGKYSRFVKAEKK